MSSTPTLDAARPLLESAEGLLDRALTRAREITDGGNGIDDHQVLVERVTYAATEARAARALLDFVAEVRSEGRGDAMLETTSAAA